MKIFFSWSGNLSHNFARTLSDWLECVFPSITYFISSSDISPGSRWSNKLTDELEECKVGILCITYENISSPWINFEAGALSKHINEAGVIIPMLINISNDEIRNSPLSQFQTLTIKRDDIYKLTIKICDILNCEIKTDKLKRIFDTWYPDLSGKIAKLNIDSNPKINEEGKYNEVLSNFNRVRQDFDEKIKNINTILLDITSKPKVSKHFYNLDLFEGFWESESNDESCSIYYGKLIEGKLYFPYLYGGDCKSHYFNINIINDTMYGRFRWFDSEIKGYIYLKIVDQNTLKGGWLPHEDIFLKNDEDIRFYKDETIEIILRKQNIQVKEEPSWVKEYVDKKVYEEIIF